MIVQGNIINGYCLQTMLDKSLTPEESINFSRTRFYKTWKEIYGYLQKFDIPRHLVDKLRVNHIYPIKFTRDSQIYFFKINSINATGEISYVKCLVYLRYKDLRICEVERSICPAQLLLCEKYIKMPAKLLIFYFLTTKYGSWEEPLIIDDTMEIKGCSIEIVAIDQLSLIYTYKKALEVKMPFRRLPANLSEPNLKYLALTNLTESTEIHEFVDIDNKYLGFFNNSFNFGYSLLRVRISFKNDYERGQMKRCIKDCLNHVEISQSPRIRKKSTKRRDRTQNFQHSSPSVVFDQTNASSISHCPSDKPSIQSNHEDISPDLSNTDSTPLTHNNFNRPISPDKCSGTLSPYKCTRPVSSYKRAKPRRRSRRTKRRETRVPTRKANVEQAEPIESLLEPTPPSLPRRSARNAQRTQENIYTKELPLDNSNDCPDHKSETNSPDCNFQGDSKLLRHYNNPKVFYQDYQNFYNNLNNHLPRIPKMGWLEVDVYKLFRQTIQKGGYHEVTKRLLWKDVYKSLNSTTIVSNAATTVKTHYKRLLYEFEEYLLSNKDKHISLPMCCENNIIQSPIENHQNIEFMDGKLEKINTSVPILHKDFLMDNILNRKEPEVSQKSDNRPVNGTESKMNRASPNIPDYTLNYPHHYDDPRHRRRSFQNTYNPNYNSHEFLPRSPLPPVNLHDIAAKRMYHHPSLPMDLEYMNKFSPQRHSPSHIIPHFIYNRHNTPPYYRYPHLSPPTHSVINGIRHHSLRPPRFENHPSLSFDYRRFYNAAMRYPYSHPPSPYFDNQNGHYSYRRR